MAIESQPEGLVISTTDTHLPRRIGEELKHAHHGGLALYYDQDEQFSGSPGPAEPWSQFDT